MKIKTLTRLLAAATGVMLCSPSAQADTIETAGFLYGTNTWYATNTYILTNRTYVMSNAVLNIEAGTVIRGRDGAPPNYGTLFVTRGARLRAQGTPDKPIIFTSEGDDLNDPFDLPVAATSRGKWGGIVVLGNARLNASASVSPEPNPIYDVYEGLPDANVGGEFIHRFGGTNDNDNSGIMQYVSVRHGSKLLGEVNKEINGWSFCGVGRGSTVDHIEAYLNADDGIELFGGCVDIKYAVSAFNEDEAFDTDQGYNGRVQFLFVIQDSSGRDEGIESNGQPEPPYTITNGDTDQPLANYMVFNATFIGGGLGAGSGNDTMNLRKYNFSRWYNNIFTDFAGVRANIDGTSAPDVRHNIFWQHTGDGSGYGGAFCPTNENPVIDPMLRAISRANDLGLDPRPQIGSPAYVGYTNPPNDGFFMAAPYKGAFDCDNWMRGWTAMDRNAHLATFVNQPTNVIELAGFLYGTNTWYATNTYILTNRTYVMSNAVLNIEAGTVIRGRDGAPPNYGTLFVTRGARLNAEGTACNPIIFTSEGDDLNDPFDLPVAATSRGKWGGIVVLGNARLNSSASVSPEPNPIYDVYEGLPDTEVSGEFIHRFGGTNDNDISGVMRHVSVRHGSKLLGEVNKEINGWSFGGVGRGTIVECIEAYLNADDGIEMFGGCVDIKYAVSAFNEDEAFDTDQGYNGRVQFLFVIQDDSGRDEGTESNGQPEPPYTITNGDTDQPLANYMVFNATFIGGGLGAGSGNDTMNLRKYNFSRWHNNVFTDFAGVRANIDGTSAPDVRHNIFWQHTGDGSGYGGAFCPTNENPVVDPLLRAISRANDKTLDPRPSDASPTYTGFTNAPNDGFFTQADRKGAFANDVWAMGWSALDHNAHLAFGIPAAQKAVAITPLSPVLTILNIGDGKVGLSFPTQTGFNYQVRSKSPITGSWSDAGAPIPGTGGSVTGTQAISGSETYFQVEVE